MRVFINDDIAHFDWQAALPLLSAQRREQALRFKHELGRKQCAAAYLLLCEGLRQEYGITEPPLFDYGEHGKPFLAAYPDIHFSLSHCREGVLCVVDNHPVGADIESIREYKESLVSYTMNSDEQAQILHSANPAMEFTKLWTMKEAVLKQRGTGITNDLKSALTDYGGQLKTVVNEEKKYIYTIATLKTEQL